MLRVVTLVSISMSAFYGSAGAAAQQKPDAAAKAYQALLDEYEKVGLPRKLAGKFFDFAEKHAKDPEAVDALAWIATHLRYRPEAARAIGLLQRDHLQSRHLGKVVGPVAGGLTPAAERLLQAALERNPHADVQAQACFHLIAILDGQIRLAKQLQQQPALRKRAAQYYGKEMTDYLVSLSEKNVDARKERLCETMLKSFAKEPAHDGPVRTKEALRHAPSFYRQAGARHRRPGHRRPDF
jgi:hypothetical protein